MPIKAKQVTYTFTPDELKEILKEHIKQQEPGHRDSRFEISFKVEQTYDHFDRPSGGSSLTSASVTIRHTNGPG